MDIERFSSLQASCSNPERVRDTTAALPLAPDAERTALHITQFAAQLKNQLAFNKPSIRFNQFFDSVIQQGFHSPTMSLRDFLNEIEDLDEDLCTD